MRLLTRYLLFSCLLAGAGVAAAAREPSANNVAALDRIVAIVNDEVITQNELEREARMANEQLRRDNKTRDPLAEGMGDAGRDDCMHAPEKPSVAGGLLALPEVAARALTGKCAK